MSLFMYSVLFMWSAQIFVGAEIECPDIITHKEWDGMKPEHVNYLAIPLDLVVIQHTVTHSCLDDASCAEVVRNLQKTHVKQSFLWDIAPSFLIGGTGKVYEGRGWLHVGMHTPGFNNQSYSIAFIGNFQNVEPTLEALESAKTLLKCGVEQNYLASNHSVVLHKQLIPTESPGLKLVPKIMSWTNWIPDVSAITKRVDKALDALTSETQDLKTVTELILVTEKNIDLLTQSRDVIAELLTNLHKLALQTLNTVAALAKGLANTVKVFFETFLAALRAIKNKAYNVISAGLGDANCLNQLKIRVNRTYEDTEQNVRNCADKSISDIDAMIKSVGGMATNALDFTNKAGQETRNCTELNFGLKKPTKACLDSVASHVQTVTSTFTTQKDLTIAAIESALKMLPSTLETCSKKHLVEASSGSAAVIAEVAGCSVSRFVPKFRFPSFG